MNSDPAVVAGVMTAELHPFSVALPERIPEVVPATTPSLPDPVLSFIASATRVVTFSGVIDAKSATVKRGASEASSVRSKQLHE